MKFQQEYTFNHYNYPEEILNYIPALVPSYIKGKYFRELGKKALLKEFCKNLEIKLLQCFIGSHFWKIYWKKFAGKKYFLVKFHSVISNNIKITPHHRCLLNYILFLENSKLYMET